MQIVQENNLSLSLSLKLMYPKHTVVAEFCNLLLVQSQDKPSMQIMYKYSSSHCHRMWGDLLVKRVLVNFAGANQTLRQRRSVLPHRLWFALQATLVLDGVRLCAQLQPRGQSVLPETSQSRTFTLRITEIL